MRVFTAVFAIASGIIVLLGYFFPIAQLDQLRLQLIDWAIIIAGMAVLIGIYNLVAVQMEKIRAGQKGSLYGVLLILSLILTFGLGLLLGPNDPYMLLAVDAVIVPVEASLMAILAVTLIYASIRLFRRRVDVTTVLFLLTAVLFLLAVMLTSIGPIPGDWIALQLKGFVDILSRGGSRGLLLGIALGTLLTGLRVLFGIDRPYGGN
ncbi:MAG TPA: hypothetical protein VJM08_11345 [Anaerolineales bacterium]|nr:hypothetical protein [Anaerolineales bacterium]